VVSEAIAVRKLTKTYVARQGSVVALEDISFSDDAKVLRARAVNWRLDKVGVKRWGENSVANYAAYVDFLLKQAIIKQKVEASDLVTNELIDEINKFDAARIAAEAKGYKVK